MPAWFEPLLAVFADQPVETTTLTLTLAEIEALADGPTPAGLATRTYWQGRASSVRRRLIAIGWHMARFNRASGTLTFARVPAPP